MGALKDRMDGQLDVLDLLAELEATPVVTFTIYRTENFKYGCPCSFCGRTANPYHPEGSFWKGLQSAVCMKCDGKKKPPHEEWKLI